MADAERNESERLTAWERFRALADPDGDPEDYRRLAERGDWHLLKLVEVQRILAAIDALRAQLATPIPHVTPADFAALESVFDELKSMDQAAERDAIRAQLAAAQADTERLDWLGENWWKFRSMPTGRDLRECIDAARAASHKESRDE